MVEPQEKDTEGQSLALDLAIRRANALLEGQLRDNDALDMKAQGVIALVVGIIGFLIAVHHDINSLWWIPALSLGIAGTLLLAAIWPRGYDFGPDPNLFYSFAGELSALEIRQQMLAELLSSVSNNKPVLGGKIRLLTVAFASFGVSVIGSVLVSLVR